MYLLNTSISYFILGNYIIITVDITHYDTSNNECYPPRFRVFNVDCGELFWSQEFATCVRYPATGCQMMTPSPTSPATSKVTYKTTSKINSKTSYRTTSGTNLKTTTIEYGEYIYKETLIIISKLWYLWYVISIKISNY